MKKTALLLLVSFSAFAASDLVKDFTKRRKTQQSRPVRRAYTELRKHQLKPDNLIEIEVLNGNSVYAVKFSNQQVCVGDLNSGALDCYNSVGYQTLNAGVTIPDLSSFVGNSLVDSFIARQSIPQTNDMTNIYTFLEQQSFQPANLQELEVLNSNGKFALRFLNDDVCFGDIGTASLQCFNQVGFRTFFEAGDAD